MFYEELQKNKQKKKKKKKKKKKTKNKTKVFLTYHSAHYEHLTTENSF